MSLTVGFSTRKPNPEFIEYLKKSSGFKKIEIIEKVNNGEKSLSQVYNEILNESSNDIVVLCHDDIYFDTTSWYSKVIRHFEKTDYGILGVAGTTSMPKSGRWWEDRTKMFGIVNHEHEGKKWESKYSASLGNDIRETVIVDGLFLVIDKRKIKKQFDESVEGFHFYDVEFCYQNFLESVKVGVIFNVRITHRSIGQTNAQWESNREIFSKKYESVLPSFIPRNEKERLKLLISLPASICSNENVKKLLDKCVSYNYEINIITDDEKSTRSFLGKYNFNFHTYNIPPGFKVGDGKWSLQTQQGPQVSQPNMLYKVSQVNYDLILLFEDYALNRICKYYSEIPKIKLSKNVLIQAHHSIKKVINLETNIDETKKIFFSVLNSSNKVPQKQKIKIISGFSDRGGSTVAFINLTNNLNDFGYDCTFYGPHDYHIDKCKSGFQNEVTFEPDDVLICHFMDLPERPKVKKVIFSTHEKWWFDFSKVNHFWDEVVFLHQEHREFHKNYEGEFRVIPNFKENLYSPYSVYNSGVLVNKSDLNLVAGIIGTIEDRKQTHVSIERAIKDGCEKILLYGHIGDNNYYETYVKPMVDGDRVMMIGHMTNKQDMYNSIGRVYHSSKGEVACLVKDECYLTSTKFFGNQETENEVSKLNNEEIFKLWQEAITQ